MNVMRTKKSFKIVLLTVPMKFPAVKIGQESFQLSRRVHVFEGGEQVHVAERIDGNQRQIRLTLAQVM